jgi:hypothetical protein
VFHSFRLAFPVGILLALALIVWGTVTNIELSAAALLTSTPNSGLPDDDFTIAGSGFPGNNTVKIYWDNVLFDTDYTNSSGSFSVTLSVPSAANGPHTLKVVVGTVSATATFTVVSSGPTASPTSTATPTRTPTPSAPTPTPTNTPAPTITPTPTSTPAPPTGCTAPTLTGTDSNGTGGGNFRLSWSAPNAATYRVQFRNVGSTSWETMTTTAGTAVGGTEPQEREYRVRIQTGTCSPLPGPYSPAFNPPFITDGGIWELGVPLNKPRSGASATQLQDGTILLVGGGLASVELWSPATGSWTTVGALSTARSGHTATLLPDGRVLVAGGSDPNGTLTSAELYDPVTQTWSPAASMTTARYSHSATLLSGGKVLVVGGCCDLTVPPGCGNNQFPVALRSAEVYDPATDSWQAVGMMATGRYALTATLLGDGSVLVAGGNRCLDYRGNGTTAAERYYPQTAQWESASTMVSGRGSGPTATLLADGSVLVTGGQMPACCSSWETAERYIPGSNNWQAAGSMAGKRRWHTATLLPNGTVLVAGGSNQAGPPSAGTAEVYRPTSGTWSYTGNLNQARYGHAAVLLGDGTVLVAGGSSEGGQAGGVPDKAERYIPAE